MSHFRGAWRSIFAFATAANREASRNGTILVLAVVFLVYMGLYPGETDPGSTASAARFIDYAFGGLVVELLLTGIFLGATASRGGGAGLLTRLAGPAQTIWGRGFGLLILLTAMGAVAGGIIALHYAVRFGDVGDQVVNRAVHSETFSSPYRTYIMRGAKGKIAFEFPFVTADAEGRWVVGRFQPKLFVREANQPLRSRYPIKIIIEDEAKKFRRTDVVWILGGKPTSFRIQIPRGRSDSDRLILTVEKIDSRYGIKIRHDDLVLLGAPQSLLPNILRGGLVTGLYAAVFAIVVAFIAARLGLVFAVPSGLALLVLMTSLDIVDLSFLSRIDASTRAVALGALETILPNFDAYDAGAILSRRNGVEWLAVGELAIRSTATLFLLGFLHAVIPMRGREQ